MGITFYEICVVLFRRCPKLTLDLIPRWTHSGINQVQFDDSHKSIRAMVSLEGEVVPLLEPVTVTDKVRWSTVGVFFPFSPRMDTSCAHCILVDFCLWPKLRGDGSFGHSMSEYVSVSSFRCENLHVANVVVFCAAVVASCGRCIYGETLASLWSISSTGGGLPIRIG